LKHASLNVLFILFLFSESNEPFEENLKKKERKAKSHCLISEKQFSSTFSRHDDSWHIIVFQLPSAAAVL